MFYHMFIHLVVLVHFFLLLAVASFLLQSSKTLSPAHRMESPESRLCQTLCLLQTGFAKLVSCLIV